RTNRRVRRSGPASGPACSTNAASDRLARLTGTILDRRIVLCVCQGPEASRSPSGFPGPTQRGAGGVGWHPVPPEVVAHPGSPGSVKVMNTLSSPSPPDRRQRAIDQLLETVRGCGPHGHLVDVRESLRYVLGPGRPLVMLCPHADDGAITAACLIHEYAVRRGLPVIEVLVFAGERNVAAPWLNDQKKVTVREGEFRLECSVLGAEGVCWNLEGYHRPGYQPTESDIATVVDWFGQRRPGAVIVPPANDAHVAHR